MLMLSIEDAVKVAKRLITDQMDVDEIVYQEFEQKCWILPKASNTAKCLKDLICDVNPAEICAQIESDNLKEWCRTVQSQMIMLMAQLPSAEPEIIRCRDCEHYKHCEWTSLEDFDDDDFCSRAERKENG